MIILDKPYISDFLQDSLVKLGVPAFKNKSLNGFNLNNKINLLSEQDFIANYNHMDEKIIYSLSEHSLDWILHNLENEELKRIISLFKDKYLFRSMLKTEFPDFHFSKISFTDLDSFDPSIQKKPFIIKPTRGFFSAAVYQVDKDSQWPDIVKGIKETVKDLAKYFPEDVINSNEFIIEDCIVGDEYAVDAYFNRESKPIILNIMKHEFAHEGDTADRLYYTSRKVIESTIDPIRKILEKIGKVSGAKYFPSHIELRIDSEGKIGIIEANALRFAGLCVTDLAYFAYGLNNYDYFFNQKEPDWAEILKDKNPDTKYAMVLGDFPSDINIDEIKHIDYYGFRKKFSKILELRKIDYSNMPIFAISFIEFDSNTENEFKYALTSDFRDFIVKN